MSVITAAPPVLLPELLGVSPHFVLDTIVNISNNSVEHCVDAMEGFLTGWTEKRADRLKDSGGDDWDSKQEVEQGIVAFQTLLESHMDIALDFFEVWCMRNIFTIPAELPVVVPHQAGLVLDQPASKEQELLAEIDDLRRRIQVQRKLRNTYKKALRISAARKAASERSLGRLGGILEGTDLRAPGQIAQLFAGISGTDRAEVGANRTVGSSAAGKREWETDGLGYGRWAVVESINKGLVGQIQSLALGPAIEATAEIGSARDLDLIK